MLATLKELPATLLLAPIGFSTLATEIWSGFSEGFYAETGVASLLLIAVSASLTWLLVLRPTIAALTVTASDRRRADHTAPTRPATHHTPTPRGDGEPEREPVVHPRREQRPHLPMDEEDPHRGRGDRCDQRGERPRDQHARDPGQREDHRDDPQLAIGLPEVPDRGQHDSGRDHAAACRPCSPVAHTSPARRRTRPCAFGTSRCTRHRVARRRIGRPASSPAHRGRTERGSPLAATHRRNREQDGNDDHHLHEDLEVPVLPTTVAAYGIAGVVVRPAASRRRCSRRRSTCSGRSMRSSGRRHERSSTPSGAAGPATS